MAALIFIIRSASNGSRSISSTSLFRFQNLSASFISLASFSELSSSTGAFNPHERKHCLTFLYMLFSKSEAFSGSKPLPLFLYQSNASSNWAEAVFGEGPDRNVHSPMHCLTFLKGSIPAKATSASMPSKSWLRKAAILASKSLASFSASLGSEAGSNSGLSCAGPSLASYQSKKFSILRNWSVLTPSSFISPSKSSLFSIHQLSASCNILAFFLSSTLWSPHFASRSLLARAFLLSPDGPL